MGPIGRVQRPRETRFGSRERSQLCARVWFDGFDRQEGCLVAEIIIVMQFSHAATWCQWDMFSRHFFRIL